MPRGDYRAASLSRMVLPTMSPVRRSSTAPLPHLPKNLFRRRYLFIAFLVRHESGSFLASEHEHSEHGEAVVEQAVDLRLQRFVEVDEDIPAENHVEFAEGAVRDQVVLREHHVLRQRLIE